MKQIDDVSKIKIIQFLHSLEAYALGDIKKIRDNKMPIAAFILCVCFIDQLSGFIYDENISGQRNTTDRFKKFVSEYLNVVSKKQYNKDELIKLLRHKLVHNYSVTDKKIPRHKKYALEYENPSIHLHTQDDTVFINIDGFISDIENAFNLYKKNLSTNDTLIENAINHFDVYGILIMSNVEIKG